jgi:hypothetical protein
MKTLVFFYLLHAPLLYTFIEYFRNTYKLNGVCNSRVLFETVSIDEYIADDNKVYFNYSKTVTKIYEFVPHETPDRVYVTNEHNYTMANCTVSRDNLRGNSATVVYPPKNDYFSAIITIAMTVGLCAIAYDIN